MTEALTGMNGSTIAGGAMLPHAPQFFTLPPTEDKEVVQRVKDVASRIGDALRAMEPDIWLTISNDHAQQYFHQCAPPFTLHVGGRATGEFAGRTFDYHVPSEISFELVRELYRAGFDPAFTSSAAVDYALGIPLTHLGVSSTAKVLPIYVNAYLPPQPTMERCYAFGVALAAAVTRLGLKAVIIASGGMSHFPGTDRYAQPDLAFDQALLERLAKGHLKTLIGFSDAALDETGNIELRCWAVAAGALGDRKPDIVQIDPSWHHNYASLGFLAHVPQRDTPHYPSIAPELVNITRLLHGLAHDAKAQCLYIDDAGAYVSQFELADEQRRAALALDIEALGAMGVHPLVSFLADMQVRRLRQRTP